MRMPGIEDAEKTRRRLGGSERCEATRRLGSSHLSRRVPRRGSEYICPERSEAAIRRLAKIKSHSVSGSLPLRTRQICVLEKGELVYFSLSNPARKF